MGGHFTLFSFFMKLVLPQSAHGELWTSIAKQGSDTHKYEKVSAFEKPSQRWSWTAKVDRLTDYGMWTHDQIRE